MTESPVPLVAAVPNPLSLYTLIVSVPVPPLIVSETLIKAPLAVPNVSSALPPVTLILPLPAI